MEFSLYIYKAKSTQNWKVFWTRIDEMGNIFYFAFTEYLNIKNGSYWIPEKVPAFPQEIVACSIFSHLCELTALSERRHFSKTSRCSLSSAHCTGAEYCTWNGHMHILSLGSSRCQTLHHSQKKMPPGS